MSYDDLDTNDHTSKKTFVFPKECWWRCRDLNPGHSGYEPLALTN